MEKEIKVTKEIIKKLDKNCKALKEFIDEERELANEDIIVILYDTQFALREIYREIAKKQKTFEEKLAEHFNEKKAPEIYK